MAKVRKNNFMAWIYHIHKTTYVMNIEFKEQS